MEIVIIVEIFHAVEIVEITLIHFCRSQYPFLASAFRTHMSAIFIRYGIHIPVRYRMPYWSMVCNTAPDSIVDFSETSLYFIASWSAPFCLSDTDILRACIFPLYARMSGSLMVRYAGSVLPDNQMSRISYNVPVYMYYIFCLYSVYILSI